MISKFSQTVRSVLSDSRHLQSAWDFGRSVVLTSVVITAVVAGIRQVGTLEPMEVAAFDQMMRLRPDKGPDERLLVVAITEQDIQKIQEATLSDANLNRLLGKLEQYKPLAIGVDIFRDVPIGTGRAELLKRLQKSDRIIAVCKADNGDNPGVPPPPGIAEDRVGVANQVVDLDGAIRRSLLFVTPAPSDTSSKSSAVPGNICADSSASLPSLNFQLAFRYLETRGIQPEFTPNEELKLGSKVLKPLASNSGGYQNADVGGYQMLLNYRSAKNAAKQVTLSDVLEGKIDPKLVKDRLVLVGYTAPSKRDNFETPYSTGQQEEFKMPGVFIHAQIVSQILGTVLDNQPLFWFWSEWGEILWIAGWSLVGGALAWRIRHPAALGLAGVGTVGGLGAIGFVIFTQAGWVPIAAPALGLIATAGSVVLVDRFEKGGYAKKIYRGVQKLFNIEIDEEEKSRQLAEYDDMIGKVQQWQQQAQELENPESLPPLENVSQLSGGVVEVSSSDSSPESSEMDYFEQLQRKVEAATNSQSGEVASVSSSDSSPQSPEIDYFEQLQRKVEAATNPQSGGVASVSSSDPSPESSEMDYFEQLQRKVEASTNPQSDEVTSVSSSDSSPESPQIDYFEQLQRKVEAVTNPQSDEVTSVSSSDPSPESQQIDYFEQLQRKVEAVTNPQSDEVTSVSSSDSSPESPQIDYFEQLQRQVEAVTNPQSGEVTSVSSSDSSPESPQMDYFEQLQRKVEAATNPQSDEVTSVSSSDSSPESPQIDYLAQLQRQVEASTNPQSDEVASVSSSDSSPESSEIDYFEQLQRQLEAITNPQSSEVEQASSSDSSGEGSQPTFLDKWQRKVKELSNSPSDKVAGAQASDPSGESSEIDYFEQFRREIEAVTASQAAEVEEASSSDSSGKSPEIGDLEQLQPKVEAVTTSQAADVEEAQVSDPSGESPEIGYFELLQPKVEAVTTSQAADVEEAQVSDPSGESPEIGYFELLQPKVEAVTTSQATDVEEASSSDASGESPEIGDLEQLQPKVDAVTASQATDVEDTQVSDPSEEESAIAFFEHLQRRIAEVTTSQPAQEVTTSQPAQEVTTSQPAEVEKVQASHPSPENVQTNFLDQLRQRRVEEEEIANPPKTSQQLVLEITETEIEILERYCQKTERSQTEVLRELIRSLQND